MRTTKISSKLTKPMLMLWTLVLGIGGSLFVYHIDIKWQGNHMFGIFIWISAIALNIYLLLKLTEVTLTENELVFKRIFGPEKRYSFSQIGYTSSFLLRRLQFTTVEMHDEAGEIEKFLIMNNYALLFGDNVDAEEILLGLRRAHK